MTVARRSARVCIRARTVAHHGDGVDLDELPRIAEAGHTDKRAGRRSELGTLHDIPHGDLGFASLSYHVDGGLHDRVGTCPGSFQRGQQVRQDLFGLRSVIIGSNQLPRRVQRHRPGREDESGATRHGVMPVAGGHRQSRDISPLHRHTVKFLVTVKFLSNLEPGKSVQSYSSAKSQTRVAPGSNRTIRCWPGNDAT